MSLTKVKTVQEGSPADLAGVRPGETLLQIGEHRIVDVLDYKYYAYDPSLTLLLEGEDGHRRRVRIEKDVGEDLGL